MQQGVRAAPPRLITPRLALRQFADGDADALHALSLVPAVRRYLWHDRVIPPERAAEFVDESQACFAQRGFGIYGVFPRDTDDALPPEAMIGFAGLQLYEDGEQVELRFAVHPDHWGKGLASEAMLCVLHDAFEREVVEEVIAAADTPNQRSVRTLQRLGMSFERRGRWHGLDTMFYAMCREDFHEFHDGD